MIYFLSIIHILACIFIVIFILLQDPKGGILGVLGGGGGSKSLFGSGGASLFLVNVTKWLATTFVITSIALSYLSVTNKDSKLMLKAAPSQSPLTPTKKTPTKKTPTKK